MGIVTSWIALSLGAILRLVVLMSSDHFNAHSVGII